MTGYTQWNLSCYKENTVSNNSVTRSSEGNCQVVSAYNVLQYLADTKWANSTMPKSTSMITYAPSVSEPNIYSRYYNNGNSFVCQYELINRTYYFPNDGRMRI